MPTTLLASDTGLEGINGQTLRPALDGNGLIGLDGSKTLLPGSAYVGFFLDYSRRPLSILNPSRFNAVTDLVSDRLMSSFQGSIGILPSLSVAVEVPVLLRQWGTRCDTFNCSVLSSYSGSALGDIRVDLKWRLLKDQENFPGLSLILRNAFPTGSQESFVGGGGEGSYETRIVLDKTLGSFYLAANTGYRTINRTQILGTLFDDEWTYGVGAALTLPKDFRVMAEVEGSTPLNDFSIDRSPLEARTGFSKDVGEHTTVALAAGTKLNNAFGAPDIRVIANVGAHFGKKEDTALKKQKTLVGTVYFRFDQSVFLDKHLVLLRDIVQQWKSRKQTKLFVSAGFADALGVDEYNERLTRLRAESVKKALIQLGVPAEMIQTQSYGNQQARRLRRDFKDFWKDRRVDIYEE